MAIPARQRPVVPPRPRPYPRRTPVHGAALKLMWWQFRKHKAAQFAMVVLGVMYFLAIFADLFAPYGPRSGSRLEDAPPTRIHLTARTAACSALSTPASARSTWRRCA